MRLFLALILCATANLAYAQSADSIARLVARCGNGECQNALSATLAGMDLDATTNDTLEEDLTVLALTLYGVAQTADDQETEQRVASALYILATVSPDEEQAQRFEGVADAIASGDTSLYDTQDPFSASPS